MKIRSILLPRLMEDQRFKLVACYRGMTHGNDTMISIHAAGCSDIAREKAEKSLNHLAELPGEMTAEEAKRWVIKDLVDGGHEEGSWTPSDITAYPCCKKGPKEQKPVPEGKCSGSGQEWKGEIDRSYVYPHGFCSVCGRSLGAKGGRVPMHGAR